MIVHRLDREKDGHHQCSSKVTLEQRTPRLLEWRKSRYGEEGAERCTRWASWLIDEKPYCSLHGGPMALAYLAGE